MAHTLLESAWDGKTVASIYNLLQKEHNGKLSYTLFFRNIPEKTGTEDVYLIKKCGNKSLLCTSTGCT